MRKTTKLLLLLSAFSATLVLSACKSTPEKQQPLLDSNPLSAAYAEQKHAVEQLKATQNARIIGYKAGLTSKAGQTKFSVTEPVAGVLFLNGLSHKRDKYQRTKHHKLMLETELGFILKQDITQPISTNELEKFIGFVVPVVELPDLPYTDLSKVTGMQLIRDNVASNKVLMGQLFPYNSVAINAISTELRRNGETVIQGKASDAMGDQQLALVWLINRLLASGYSLEQGQLLITGALGKMIPAEKGNYETAYFGLTDTPIYLAFSIVD